MIGQRSSPFRIEAHALGLARSMQHRRAEAAKILEGADRRSIREPPARARGGE